MKAIVATKSGPPDVLQLIDRRYPLQETAEARGYAETGPKQVNEVHESAR